MARNVTLASVPVGNQTPAELQATVEELAADLPDTEVVIDAGDFSLTTTAGELGMSVDVDRTIEEVREESQDGPLPTRPVRWVQSFFGEREVDAVLAVDVEQLAATMVSLEGDRRTVPVEPSLEATTEAVKLVPGTPGTELTVHDVVAALPQHVDDVSEPITIAAEQTITEPAVSDESVAALAEQANSVTAGTITLETGGATNEVDGSEFRPAFGLAIDGDTPRLTMQPEPVAEILSKNVPAKPNPTGVRFDIQGGVPVPVGGEDAAVCCTEDAPETIVAALLAGETTIPLPTRTQTAAQGREWAAGLGVKEIIGSYTTNHKGGESRVTNIHRMADLLRGTLIPPGTTFSVNDTVGRRTVEKGFVEGGVIQDGEFTDRHRWRRQPVRARPVQRCVLRRSRHPHLQGALQVHQPLPLRPRGHARLPRRRPEDPQRHALRHRDLAELHEHLDHRRPVVDTHRRRRPDRRRTRPPAAAAVTTERTRTFTDGQVENRHVPGQLRLRLQSDAAVGTDTFRADRRLRLRR